MTKISHCTPRAKYTFATVCLMLQYVCRNDCHSFDRLFFFKFLYTIWHIWHKHYREHLSETFLVLLVLISRWRVPYLKYFYITFPFTLSFIRFIFPELKDFNIGNSFSSLNLLVRLLLKIATSSLIFFYYKIHPFYSKPNIYLFCVFF